MILGVMPMLRCPVDQSRDSSLRSPRLRPPRSHLAWASLLMAMPVICACSDHGRRVTDPDESIDSNARHVCRSVDGGTASTSLRPRISADEATILFEPGVSSQSKTLAIANSGAAALIVIQITLQLRTAAPATGAEFEFRIEDPLPWEVEHAESGSVEVIYSPVDDLDDVAELTISSNDPCQPELVLELRLRERR